MKIHRELGIAQKAAWLLIQRIREALVENGPLFVGILELDETYADRKKRDKYANKRSLRLGTAGKAMIVSAKGRHRHINEFSGRHNIRGFDTLDQMSAIVRGMEQKRLRYAGLIA